MKKSLIALAFGTLGLGIAEFVMMGILPDVAKDLGISIPTAGHFISAYALGVCVGAPVLTLARKYPLKHILLVLVTLIMIGNICAAMAPNYWVLLVARFISGLNDHCQSVWCTFGYFLKYHAFLACHFPAGWYLGNCYPILYLAMGSACRRLKGYRL